ncbi:Ig-like domain-containing protein [Synechococcus sp. RS9902]|uniref:Ig-like domain-containing protein n=1 Tax=Synechococcus sp. RS9902 TaxID=221345 RepID=UPI001647DB68|nr:Ig-like domain-containing protein [Synechococcus sp. RS9902]QNI98452.1 hypothetical protein SynRS9902_02581 [Synechococcus sp. RS9902]
MSKKAKIKNIFDNYGPIKGNLSSGQITDDQKPTLSGTLSKSLGKKEDLYIYSGNEFIGEAKTKGKKWNFTPKSKLESDQTHIFKAVISKKDKLVKASSSNSYTTTLDNTKPALLISNDIDGVAKGDIVFELEFSENVNLSKKDIKLKGGKGGEFTGADSFYEYVVSPKKNKKGNITLSIEKKAFSDEAGNTNAKNYSFKQAYDTRKIDTTPPTFVISSNAKGITNKDITLSFVFSEKVKDFTKKDVKVSNGDKSKFKGSGDSYSLVVSPDNNSEGDIIIKTKAGIVSDLAGNKNTEAQKFIQKYDTKAPTLKISSKEAGDGSDDVKFKFNFSEKVDGFKSKDLKVSGGKKGKFSGSGASYSLIVSPDQNSKSSIKIKTKAGMVSDLVGNQNSKGQKIEHAYDTRIQPIAKNFVSPLEAQAEDTIVKNLNFGDIYSELVKAKDFPAGSFTSDNFKIKNVSIDGSENLSASKAGITVDKNGSIKIDTTVDAYQYLNDGEVVDVVTKFIVTANNGLSDTGEVTFKVEGVDEVEPGTRKPGLAKNFVSKNPPQLEDTVVKGLNFGDIYSELVRAKSYPKGTFTSDSFEIKSVSIDEGQKLSAAEAGITVNKSGSIKIDTNVNAYQSLNDNDLVNVVATFKVIDNNDQFDLGTVTFQVLGVTD